MLNFFSKRNILRPIKPQKNISKFEFIALIAALLALNALTIDIMLPALPDIAQSMGLNNANDAQLVISSYLFGVGISMLFFGPVADRFGRRAPLYFGFIIYVLTSLAAIIAPSFAMLLLLRFVQGLGTAAFRVVAIAVVRDSYSGRAMAEIMSLTYMIFMIVPILAPGVGQIILFAGGWRLIFLFVAITGIVTGVWAYFRLPETLDKADQRPLTLQSVLGGFKIVLSNQFATLYAIIPMFMFGALLGFLHSSQQIFADIYGFGAYFPVAFAGIALAMAIAAYLNSRMVGHFGMRRIAHFATIIFLISSILLLLFSLFGEVHIVIFYSLIIVCLFMFSWISANANSLAMQPLGKVAGTAASAFGFIQTIGATAIGMIIGRMFNQTIMPLAIGFSLVGIVCLLLVLIAEKGKLFGSGEE